MALIPNTNNNSNKATKTTKLGKITELYRYAVKGLSGDILDSVKIVNNGETFPDDRKYALLKVKNKEKWEKAISNCKKDGGPEWLHKENFLCAFSAPELLSRYQSTYSITIDTKNKVKQPVGDVSYCKPCDDHVLFGEDIYKRQSILTLYDRYRNNKVMLDEIDLSTTTGRKLLGDYFSKQSGEDVVCITNNPTTNDDDDESSEESSAIESKHQFGNTSSGWKKHGDTRTVHIVNAASVRTLSEKIGIPLNPSRFRPNIVFDSNEPWCEFDWVDNDEILLQCGRSMKLRVISKTVRCEGISIDPRLDEDQEKLDIPALLVEHFPEYGPYLGVYAVIEEGGTLSIDDTISLIENDKNK